LILRRFTAMTASFVSHSQEGPAQASHSAASPVTLFMNSDDRYAIFKSFLAGLVNLVEYATVGEVGFLGQGPAAGDVVDGE
jgi:hypothetical protein